MYTSVQRDPLFFNVYLGSGDDDYYEYLNKHYKFLGLNVDAEHVYQTSDFFKSKIVTLPVAVQRILNDKVENSNTQNIWIYNNHNTILLYHDHDFYLEMLSHYKSKSKYIIKDCWENPA